jgi:hypothetical protein
MIWIIAAIPVAREPAAALLGVCILIVPIWTVWIALDLFKLMVQGGDPGPAGATTNTGFERIWLTLVAAILPAALIVALIGGLYVAWSLQSCSATDGSAVSGCPTITDLRP